MVPKGRRDLTKTKYIYFMKYFILGKLNSQCPNITENKEYNYILNMILIKQDNKHYEIFDNRYLYILYIFVQTFVHIHRDFL